MAAQEYKELKGPIRGNILKRKKCPRCGSKSFKLKIVKTIQVVFVDGKQVSEHPLGVNLDACSWECQACELVFDGEGMWTEKDLVDNCV